MISVLDESSFSFNEGYQVLYFYGTSMPFHKRMSSILLNLEDKNKDMSFYSIDVYLVKTFIKRFGLKDLPTVCIFKSGKEIKRVTGIVMSSAMKALFREVKENCHE